MVRGLVIRQVFLFLDVILFGAILLTAGLVIRQLFERPEALAVVEAPSADPSDFEPLIVALRDKKDYESIQSNGLFGDAGRFDPEKEAAETPPPVPVKEDVVETTLNLKLWGTTSLSPKSIYASASIEDASTRDGSKLFFVGDAVVDNVTLEEVHSRWVILRNGRVTPPQLERLRMDGEEEGVGPMASNSARPTRPTALPATRVDLDKQAFIRELTVNYGDLITKVKPTLYKDANGKVAGITAENISDVPLAKQLGLKNGDVLQTVNNEKIDSEQKVVDMLQKYQRANSFRIGILRNGKIQNITYNFR